MHINRLAFAAFLLDASFTNTAFGAPTTHKRLRTSSRSTRGERTLSSSPPDVAGATNKLASLTSPSGKKTPQDTITNIAQDDHDGDDEDDEVFTNGIVGYEESAGSDEYLDIDEWEMSQDISDEVHDGSGKSRGEESIDLGGDTTHFAEKGTEFRDAYDTLANMNATEIEAMEECMLKVIIQDIHFTQRFESDIMDNPGKYKPQDVEDIFNKQLLKVGAALDKYLPPHLRGLVNMANPHSMQALIGFYAHYAPTMSKAVEGRLYDYCRIGQCCVDTMKRKLLNYLYNESNGEDMDEYAYGGKTDVDHSDKEVFNDLIPFLLNKSKTDAGMVSQYKKFSSALGLLSFHQLLAIGYNTERRHLLLARISNPKKRFQLHIPSAATALYIMGLQKGPEKYLKKYVSKGFFNFTISVGCHPQVFLMGAQKNRDIYPADIARVMAKHLVELYSPVINFKDGFEAKTKIMDSFGRKHNSTAGVKLGVYSHLSALVEETGLFKELDSLENKKEIEDKVMALLLESNGWTKIDIDLFVGELEDNTIELVMSRVKRFRAGAKMSQIAALLPETVLNEEDNVSIPDYLGTMIDAVASTLNKTRASVLKSIRKIKLAQAAGGERLSLLSQLAGKYNIDSASVTDDDIDKLVNMFTNVHDTSAALELVKSTAEAQTAGGERLSLLSQLAGKYNIDSASVTDDDIDKLVEMLPNVHGREEARQLVMHTAASQEVKSLATKYNDAGGKEGNGGATITQDVARLVSRSRYSKEEVFEMVEKIAQRCDATFWRNYKLFKDGMITVEIEGKEVALIEYKNNDAIYMWFAAMVGYDGIEEGSRSIKNTYGVVAWKRVGSLEYNSLVELGVPFGEDGIKLLRKGYEKVRNENIVNDGRVNYLSGVEGGATDLIADLFCR